MKAPRHTLTVASLILLSFSNTARSLTLAEYDPGAPPYTFALGIGNPSFIRGQSFMPEFDGMLSHIEVFVMRHQDATATDDLLMELRAGTSLANPILASGTIPYASIPAGDPSSPGTNSNATFMAVDFAPISVDDANTYSIWLRTGGTSELYGWWGNGSNPYVDGTALTNSSPITNQDVGFRAAVPEPSTAVLAILGSIVGASRRRRSPRSDSTMC